MFLVLEFKRWSHLSVSCQNIFNITSVYPPLCSLTSISSLKKGQVVSKNIKLFQEDLWFQRRMNTIYHNLIFNFLNKCRKGIEIRWFQYDAGKNTWVGCHFLLQASSQPRYWMGSPALQVILYRVSYHGSPICCRGWVKVTGHQLLPLIEH